VTATRSVFEEGPKKLTLALWGMVGVSTLAAWWFTLRDARRMAGGMSMAGGWTMSMMWMPGQSALRAAFEFLLAWEVMMFAMMLPSVAPFMLLYGRVMGQRGRGHKEFVPPWIFGSGYFAVWLAFGVVAYGLGISFTHLTMKSLALARITPVLTGVVVLAAGAYQLTPWKQSCLAHCRTPLDFVMAHWHEGTGGAFRMGLHHGAYCALCCWGLMAVQVAVGIMNVPLMLVLALVILLEKILRPGPALARAVGIALALWGVWIVGAQLFNWGQT
jgi:predicted metal-binding membrane protein